MDCENKDFNEAIFDLEKEYLERIVPIAEKLMEECKEIGLPYSINFVIKNNEESHAVGVLASPCDKKCVVTGKMMLAANMVKGNKGIIPVPISEKDPASMLAALAIAGLMAGKED